MNRIAFAVGKVVLPPLGWALCVSKGHGRVAWTESLDKVRTIETVEFAHSFLGDDLSLEEQVKKVYAADPFRALWLAEGVGLHYGRMAIQQRDAPQKLLAEGPALKLPHKILLMAHAGMGMAIARHFLDEIKKNGGASRVREAVEQIVRLIKGNSRQGYLGIAFEPCGMATRFFYGRDMFLSVVNEVSRLEPTYVPHLWHGAGRGLYFVNFIPHFGEPWPSFRLVDQESSDPVSRSNLMAGLSSGIMMVNMQAPQVMEAIVRSRVAKFSAEDADAFSNGVVCSAIMRNDTTPDEHYMLAFADYTPDPDVEALWNRLIKEPVKAALKVYYPVLRDRSCLEVVCSYQPVAEIVQRLQAGSKSGGA